MSESVRWKFADASGHEDHQLRKSISGLIDDWWIEFVREKERIARFFKQESDFDVSAFMNSQLNPIHSRLMWEFGPAVHKSGHRLVNLLGPILLELILHQGKNGRRQSQLLDSGTGPHHRLETLG